MKKRVLTAVVALLLISSMLLSSILGVSNADYFKTLSKKLDFETGSDLALQYALYDANGVSSTSHQ